MTNPQNTASKKYWLLKSEPTCYSIDDMAQDKKTQWTGVRNYQARNFMRDDMKAGDLAFFYHSSTDPKAIVGIVKISAAGKPDLTALDKKDDHYDPKSTKENPIWYGPEIAFVKKFADPVTLDAIKFNPKLKGIMLTAVGSRLSVQPVSEVHFRVIEKMAQ